MTKPLALLSLLLLLLSAPAKAQEAYEPIDPLPLGSGLLTLPSPHVADTKSWEVRFGHRFTQAVNSGADSLWGLDSAANVTIGIAYVPIRDLELSLTRSNILKDFEVAAKYVVVQEAPAIPLSLTLRAGGDFRTAKNLSDRSSLFGQAILSRQFGGRVEIFALPTFVTDAGRYSTGNDSVALFSNAFNVPVAVAITIAPGLTLVGEAMPSNRDLPDSIDRDFSWALGVKKAVGGHHFELMVTNSLATTVDQYATSTFQGTALRHGDVHIGFNIERQFGGD
jgi:hypothetical protein